MNETQKLAASLITEFGVLSMGLHRAKCNAVLKAWGLPEISFAEPNRVEGVQKHLNHLAKIFDES